MTDTGATGRMASITDWHGASTRFSYDPDDNMIGESYPNGVVTTMAYDNADRLLRSTTTELGGTILDRPYARVLFAPRDLVDILPSTLYALMHADDHTPR